MVAVPVVIVALIAASVFVQCDRRLHPDGLPSRIDAERLVLSARARAEARPTVPRAIGRHGSDRRAVGGDFICRGRAELPHDDDECTLEAAAQPPHHDGGATARARRRVRR